MDFCIKTGNIILRPVSKIDSEVITKIMLDPENIKMSGDEMNHAAISFIINVKFPKYHNDYWDFLNFTINLDGNVIGIIQLVKIARVGHTFGLKNLNNACAIGISLSKTYWGKGIATEAIKLLSNFALNEMNITTIVSETLSTNIGMKRVFTKVGYEYLSTEISPHSGKQADYYRYDKNIEDCKCNLF